MAYEGLQQNPQDFVQRDSILPLDRPDVDPPQPKPIMSPEVISKMPVDMLIDSEVVDMVMDRYELSRAWRRTKRIVWDKCWQHMKAIPDRANKQSWQSTTFMPLTSKVVEIITANLHSALLAPDMPVEYQSKRADMDQLVRAHNDIIQTDLEKCNAKAELTDFLRNICVMGTAIGEVGYIKQQETVMVKQRQTASPMDSMLKSLGVQTGDVFTPQQMLVKDYATIKNVDLYDIYPQPRVAEFSKDMWVVHKSTITNRELVMGSRDTDPYYRFDNVTDTLLEGSGRQRVDQDVEKQTRRFALLDYNAYTHFLDPDREHELYTFYGQIPLWYLIPELRKDRTRQYDSVPGCIKVVDGQWVIWKRISPFRDGEPPYFKGNYIRIPGEFYGIGVGELLLGLQIEKNEIRNSRMDNINFSMNKIIAVLKDKVPPSEWKRLVSEPGQIWLFHGIDDIKKAMQTVEFGNVTQDAWMASKEVDQEAQEVTAANKVTQAAGGSSDEAGGGTFRGQMLNVQQATGRWMLYARLFEWMGLSPAIKKFYQRIYQFKDEMEAQEVLGPEMGQNFSFILPEMLEKIAKLVPLGVMTMENKGVRLAQMNQFAMLWGQDPFFKRLEFARKMAVESGFQETNTILFSDEEMGQYNQMKQMMLASAGSMDPMSGQPQPLLGPNGKPIQTGQRGNVPGGMPVSGNVPGPNQGMPRPAIPPRGPGASRFDLTGAPMS